MTAIDPDTGEIEAVTPRGRSAGPTARATCSRPRYDATHDGPLPHAEGPRRLGVAQAGDVDGRHGLADTDGAARRGHRARRSPPARTRGSPGRGPHAQLVGRLLARSRSPLAGSRSVRRWLYQVFLKALIRYPRSSSRAQEPGAGEDLDVGLLDQVLRELAGAAHRARRSKERVDVVPGALGIEPALLPLDGDRGQNGTAPSPFHDAELEQLRSPDVRRSRARRSVPSRHQVTTRRPPGRQGVQVDAVLASWWSRRWAVRPGRRRRSCRRCACRRARRRRSAPRDRPVRPSGSRPGASRTPRPVGEGDALDVRGEQLADCGIDRDRAGGRGRSESRAASTTVGFRPPDEDRARRRATAAAAPRQRSAGRRAARRRRACAPGALRLDALPRAPDAGPADRVREAPRPPVRWRSRAARRVGDPASRASSSSRGGPPASRPQGTPARAGSARRALMCVDHGSCVLHSEDARATRYSEGPRNKYVGGAVLGLAIDPRSSK